MLILNIINKGGGMLMEAFVHYPKSQEKISKLGELVAKVHAEAIYEKVKTLQCSQQEKKKIINVLINNKFT